MKLYIDGEDKTNATYTVNGAAAYDSTFPIVIGNVSGGSSSIGWNKPLDYIRIYKKALTTNGLYGDYNYVNTNRNDIQWLFDHRASIWANSYYGDYPSNKYTDE